VDDTYGLLGPVYASGGNIGRAVINEGGTEGSTSGRLDREVEGRSGSGDVGRLSTITGLS